MATPRSAREGVWPRETRAAIVAIVNGELDLHYGALACLEQNSLSGY